MQNGFREKDIGHDSAPACICQMKLGFVPNRAQAWNMMPNAQSIDLRYLVQRMLPRTRRKIARWRMCFPRIWSDTVDSLMKFQMTTVVKIGVEVGPKSSDRWLEKSLRIFLFGDPHVPEDFCL